VAFAALQVLFSRPYTDRASLATSLPLIGLLTPVPPGDSASTSRGHVLFFRTVPPAITLVRWVNENAFVFISQTRPCPTFGRPVHHWVSPLIAARYFSAGPSDSILCDHLMDTLPSGVRQAVAAGPSWLYPAFAFVPV
jgi:hypothetical protein